MKKISINPRPAKGNVFSKYLGPQEAAILIELVRSVSPKVMIEFGCNLGITAMRVLDNVPTLERYIGIDVPPSYVPILECQRYEIPERAGLYAAEDKRFFLLTRPSAKLRTADLEPCDAVFIDGDHSEAAVIHESQMAKDLVQSGGIIVWHDFNNPAVQVTRALIRLHSGGWPIVSVENSWLAYMRL
jgi:predicted O-methyltransferase YrrM